MELIRMDDQFILKVWVKSMLTRSCKPLHWTAMLSIMFRNLRGTSLINSQLVLLLQRNTLIKAQPFLMYKGWYVDILNILKVAEKFWWSLLGIIVIFINFQVSIHFSVQVLFLILIHINDLVELSCHCNIWYFLSFNIDAFLVASETNNGLIEIVCCKTEMSYLHGWSQGLKSFNKAARDLLQRIQSIDGNNYPEVITSF